jgi:cold shock CspA family protein
VFDYDRALSAHLASMQPAPKRAAKPKEKPKMPRDEIRTSGYVKFVSAKGYGFLVDLESGDERSVFFPQKTAVRDIGRELVAKERVSFVVVPSKFKEGAVEATRLELIEAAKAA